ncbi:uncharacterized protein LOC108738398 isoform X2 [Agrilus planipennis]|uniref:Uncharacterized protein LOC108738398 isoform X2 n=1 Tax=Agrilus planipennis TaxID=224129 RepID=A0A1W4X4P5_AGRPL|nr:uncharacterized protein LOC108738398 isoform X2 [Agrilus planipennis]
MGCGHSKINGYFRKSKSQSNTDYSPVSVEKIENEEKLLNPITESAEDLDDSFKKGSKIKTYGGALLAQAEISTSQQDFFKLLDEKIENGPDYDSESEAEKIEREARLVALLQNWQSASVRSLNNTPVRNTIKTGNYHPKEANEGTESIYTKSSSHNRCTSNAYINSINKPYIPPSPAYISDYNQNSNLPYHTVTTFTSTAMQSYRTVTYPQDVHRTSYTQHHHDGFVPDANYKPSPNSYQPQYLNRPNRYCKQNADRTVKFNNYYNLPNDSNNSSGLHEARIEMNPLHRKQYELT